MTSGDREHCREPRNCRRKTLTARHCRGCALAARWRDPAFRALQKTIHGAALRRRWQEDQGFRDGHAKRGRETLARLAADPDVQRRRAESIAISMRRSRADPARKASWDAACAAVLDRIRRDPAVAASHRKAMKIVACGADWDHGLGDYGKAEYEQARNEGFGHADALEIAQDAVAMTGREL